MNIKRQGHLLTLVHGHSDSTLYLFFSLETAKPIEAKFYLYSPWDEGMKVCSNGLGHMTNLAAMPIYGKNNLKIFFSGTKKPMILKLCMQHWVLEYYQVCSNDDHDLFVQGHSDSTFSNFFSSKKSKSSSLEPNVR